MLKLAEIQHALQYHCTIIHTKTITITINSTIASTFPLIVSVWGFGFDVATFLSFKVYRGADTAPERVGALSHYLKALGHPSYPGASGWKPSIRI